MANRPNLSSKWTKQSQRGIRITIMRFWLVSALIILSTALIACSNAAAETETPTPSLTANPTTLPTEVPTLDPIWDYAALIEVMKTLPAEFEETSTSVSPNGNWEAILTTRVGIKYGTNEYRYNQLKVVSLGDDREFILTQRAEIFYGLSFSEPRVIQWSTKKTGLYYADFQFVDGAGLYPHYDVLYYFDPESNAHDLWAVGMFGSLSISPDETLLAYFGSGYLFMTSLVDRSAEIMLIDLPCPEQSGGFVWSPDMSRIAFTVIHDDCPPYTVEGPIIFVADTESLEMEIVHTAEELALYTIDWNQKGILVEDDSEIQWLLDPDTGEVSPAP